jgi:2-methylcitrate dehydratase PrpD
MNAAQRLALFAADLRVGSGPELHAARRLILDTVAVARAGADALGAGEIRRQVQAQAGAPEALLWGGTARVPAAEAAFANGAAAAALDFDSVHESSILHADAVVVPAALAVAERVGATGGEFLSAYVAGVEIAHRLSLATPRKGGWFGSSAAGVFGAAAAAARLLGLDASGIHHAMGIALSLSSGTKQAIVERTLTKRLQTAFAARSGVHAALAAAGGVSGPQDWLEGEYGWFRLYEAGDPARLVEGLGERFEFVATGIKKFPSCLCNHAVIDAAQSLMAEHRLAPRDVEGIEVTISPYMHRIVGKQFDPSGDAQVAAQFSVQYAAACAVHRGGVGLADIEPLRAGDPAFAALARSVKVGVEPAWPGHVSPGRVTLKTAGHGALSLLVESLPGSAARPLSDAELFDKARACFAAGPYTLDAEQSRRIADRMYAIEKVGDIRSLFQ